MSPAIPDSPFARHSRSFENNLYTYPVISRRSEGLSIGINLSLIKECNFACIYCQVDRTEKIQRERKVDTIMLKNELISLIEFSLSGELFLHPRFSGADKRYLKLRDIAFSGDGEPTTSQYFVESAKMVLSIVSDYSKKGIQIRPIVITNATMMQKNEISRILKEMDKAGGGPWVKLDAGTELEFGKVAESKYKFSDILENIVKFSSETPVILQTIVFRYENGMLSFDAEKMIQCLKDLLSRNAKFKYMQLYTLARSTRIGGLTHLEPEELEAIKTSITNETGIDVKIYP